MIIKEIDRLDAVQFIEIFHYSSTMPRLNKVFLGGFEKGKLVGVMTCGWGTRPLHTIKKIFPSFTTEDYYEIGKFCMADSMPHNSESHMLSKCLKYMKKNYPIKLLFTWSDGMLGKPGYIYQSANFLYGGFIWTDSYFTRDGKRIHPRSCGELLKENAKLEGKKKLFWITPTFEKSKGIVRYKGQQLRYVYFLCSHKERKRILKESPFDWSQKYPLKSDLKWKIRNKDITKGNWLFTGAPKYIQTLNAREVSRVKHLVSNKEGAVQSRHLAL